MVTERRRPGVNNDATLLLPLVVLHLNGWDSLAKSRNVVSQAAVASDRWGATSLSSGQVLMHDSRRRRVYQDTDCWRVSHLITP